MSRKVDVNCKIARRTLLKAFPALFVTVYIKKLKAASSSGSRSTPKASSINLTADTTSVTADSMNLTADTN